LQRLLWLISAILAKFNHLRGASACNSLATLGRGRAVSTLVRAPSRTPTFTKRQRKTAGSECAASRRHHFTYRTLLPASATMGPAAAVKSAATMEPTTMKRGRSVKSTACHSPAVEAADSTTRYITVSAIPRTTPARMTGPRTTVPSISVTPAPQPSRTVEPWASSYENAADEPVRIVVAVRRARVRSITVVSVRANRRANGYANRTDSNSHANLRLRVRQWNHQHCQHCNIFQVTHNHLPLPTRSPRSDQKTLSNPLQI